MWSPLVRRHLSDDLLWSIFQSSFYAYYTLKIMLDLLCGQLSMYCTLDTSSLGIWVLFMMQFLSFCGLKSHMSRSCSHLSVSCLLEPLYQFLWSFCPCRDIQAINLSHTQKYLELILKLESTYCETAENGMSGGT